MTGALTIVWWPWLRIPEPVKVEPPPSRFGLAALEIAEREVSVGSGERGGNNQGRDLDRFRRSLVDGRVGPAGAWCAALVSYLLEAGAIELGEPCPVKRSHSAKTLFARCLKAGMAVSSPRPGDIACWHRGAEGARTGHIAIVRTAVADGLWWSIDGNKGTFPSRVRPFPHELGEPLFLGWARLP